MALLSLSILEEEKRVEDWKGEVARRQRRIFHLSIVARQGA